MTDTAIDFARLRSDIIAATVRAVNATLYLGEERALKDVPVRKVFKGGKQTVRFKTATEIEADKELRSKLGLAPEILATPEAIARVRAAGKNPKKASLIGGQEFGFARTIEFPSTDPRRNRFGQTRGDRGLTKNRPNRANAFQPFGEDMRLVNTQLIDRNRLDDPNAERFLTSRGRNELRSGRAIRGQVRTKIDLESGRIFHVQTERERLGGGLKSTIRVVKADPSMYPIIEGWLIAGDAEHDYAKYQELGTRHNAAHPFLRPRLPEWKEELPAQLKRSLGRTGR